MDFPLTEATFCANVTRVKKHKIKMQQTFLTKDNSYIILMDKSNNLRRYNKIFN